MTNILDYFPKQFTPRDVQKDALLSIEKAWNNHEVIVVNLPVSSGKSYISKTILDWQGKGVVTTPTNILVDQYAKDFPKLSKIYGKEHYSCSEKGYTSCRSRIKAYERAKTRPLTCKGCPWLKDNRKARAPWTTKYITNNHLYAQMGKYQPVLIADEAHNLIDFLQDWHASRIDHDKFNYPRTDSGYINRARLKDWLNNIVGLDNILKQPKRGQKALRELYYELNSSSPRYLLKEEREEKQDSQGNKYYKLYLKLCPVDIRNMSPVLWPMPPVRKIILMSATIGPKDIEELGLAGYRVKYIEADSCIPADNRPVNFNPCGAIQGSKVEETANLVADKINYISGQKSGQKGLIHATYAQARALRAKLGERFIFHDKHNKKSVYTEFKDAKDDRILVASGMYEGIDLPEDHGRWQVIAKTPWPNLGEPAIAYRAGQDKDWYGWQTTKTILQACGRICRTPSDYGETVIIDSTFKRLYQNNKTMFPGWFQESVHGL